jgi:DNA-directed RNA polymerase specialized sigma subunit, sigma24 homolog
MKIEYKFVTGENVSVEVHGEFEEIMLELNNNLKNNDRKEMRRHESLDLLDKDTKSMDVTADILEDVCRNLDKDKLFDAIKTLTLQEQDFINKVFLQENPLTYSEYAKQFGLKESSLYQKLWRIKEKLKKVLNS